jgi:hypothetical protein
MANTTTSVNLTGVTGNVYATAGVTTSYSNVPQANAINFIVGAGASIQATNPNYTIDAVIGYHQLETIQAQGSYTNFTAWSSYGLVTLTNTVTGQSIVFQLTQPSGGGASNSGVNVQFLDGTLAFTSNVSAKGAWTVWITQGGTSTSTWGTNSVAIPYTAATAVNLTTLGAAGYNTVNSAVNSSGVTSASWTSSGGSTTFTSANLSGLSGNVYAAANDTTTYTNVPLANAANFIVGATAGALITNPNYTTDAVTGLHVLETIQIQGSYTNFTAWSTYGLVTLTNFGTGQSIAFQLTQPGSSANSAGVNVQFLDGTLAFISTVSAGGAWGISITKGGAGTSTWGTNSVSLPNTAATAVNLTTLGASGSNTVNASVNSSSVGSWPSPGGTAPGGTTFTLTTTVGNFIGGPGNDTFMGTFSNGGVNTFLVGDVLAGNGGTDTLIISPNIANTAMTLDDTYWAGVTGIQNIILSSTGNGAQTFSTGANFNSAFAAGGVNLTTASTGGAITIGMGTFTGAATLTTTSAAGAQTITTGSGIAVVIASSGAGALTISGANLSSVTALTTGAGAQTITSTGSSAVTVIATDVSGTQTITVGNGNNIVTDVTGTGAVTVIVGTGSNTLSIGAATATGNTSGTFNITYGTHNSTGSDNITVGTGGTSYATAANYMITGAVTGDRVTFAADAASSNAALTTMGATTLALIEAAVSGHAHAVAYGLVGGNTYVAESVSGTLGVTDTTLIELLGTRTLTAATGYVTVASPDGPTPTPPPPPPAPPTTFTLTTAVGSFVATTSAINTFNGTYSDGGVGLGNTFLIGDTITGYGSNNTLYIIPNAAISAGAANTSFTPAASPVINDSIWQFVSNIQNLSITTGAGTQTITSGAFFNAAFAAGIKLTSIAVGGAINIYMDGSNGGTVFTGAATITTTTSGTGAQTISAGSGLTTVVASANGGAQIITGANLSAVTAVNTGVGTQSITSTGTGAVTVIATNVSGTQNITLGNGNNNVTDVTGSGAVTVIVGTGSNTLSIGAATATGNTTGTFNVTYGVHTSSGPDNITAGTGGTNYATAANYVITGAVSGDRVSFAADTASSNAALTTMGATTIALIEAAVVGHAHAVAYGVVGGNTYVAESVSGVLGVTDTTLIELLGTRTLTATTGYVTVTPNPQTFTLTTAVGSFVATTAGINTFNGTNSNGGTNTFLSGDTITGNGPTNTLVITPTISAATTLDDTYWGSSSNPGTSSNISGIQAINITTGVGALTFSTGANFNTSFATGGVKLTAAITGSGALNIYMDGVTGASTAAFTGTETLNTTNSNGAQNIYTGSGLTSVTANLVAGALTLSGANLSTVNAVSTGAGDQTIIASGGTAAAITASTFAGNQTINGVGLASVILTSTGAGIQTVGNLGGDVNLTSVTLTQHGSGNQTITDISASAVTVNVTNDGVAGSQTVTTGAGNDIINLLSSAAGIAATVNAMGGTNTISLFTGHTGVDTIGFQSTAAAWNGATNTSTYVNNTISNFKTQDIMAFSDATFHANTFGGIGAIAATNIGVLATTAGLLNSATASLAGGVVTMTNGAIFLVGTNSGASHTLDVYVADSLAAAGASLAADVTAGTVILVGHVTVTGALAAANFTSIA